jgi:hypothetical protein
MMARRLRRNIALRPRHQRPHDGREVTWNVDRQRCSIIACGASMGWRPARALALFLLAPDKAAALDRPAGAARAVACLIPCPVGCHVAGPVPALAARRVAPLPDAEDGRPTVAAWRRKQAPDGQTTALVAGTIVGAPVMRPSPAPVTCAKGLRILLPSEPFLARIAARMPAPIPARLTRNATGLGVCPPGREFDPTDGAARPARSASGEEARPAERTHERAEPL